MEDMLAIYSVTDRFGIDRETISVPLGKEDDGRIDLDEKGVLEITVPETVDTADWLEVLKDQLLGLGFEIRN
jgi:hypothetical protein